MVGMQIKDHIYGSARINEPVLRELIKTRQLQRLKVISQFGLPPKYYPLKSFSRYEHSAGVMILLRRLGANLEEQVAGLLHDVSHLAFSHISDWAIADPETEGFQDSIHDKFIKTGAIAHTLRKHGFKPRRITNYKNFKLLERPIPSLCADRLDYALREFKMWADPDFVEEVLEDLTVKNDQIAFNSIDAAEKFGEAFFTLLNRHWASRDIVIRYFIFAEILKKALKDELITIDDLFSTDSEVLKKVESSKNQEVKGFLKLLEGKPLKLPRDFKLKGKVLHKKFRYVDPHVVQNGKLKRLSGLKQNYKILIKKNRERNKKGIKI